MVGPRVAPVMAVVEEEDTLRRAALEAERARGPARRRDATVALTCWKALVAGRWSLVDHFDSDGRHFLIARRARRRPPLTPRELEVARLAADGRANKLIAYD